MTDSNPAGSGSCRFFRTDTYLDAETGTVLPFTHPEVSEGEYGIPHIKEEKLPIGVALSGGGFRAATCAAGFMRGLHQTRLDDGSSFLSSVQYLSSTSGGSWFNAAFSYKAPKAEEQMKLDAFFEQDIDVHELNTTALNKAHTKGTFEHAIAEHNEVDNVLRNLLVLEPIRGFGTQLSQRLAKFGHEDVVEAMMKGAFHAVNGVLHMKDAAVKAAKDPDTQHKDQDKTEQKPEWLQYWTESVTEAFLSPFGLGIYADSTVSADNTNGNIAGTRAAAAAKKVLLACTDKSRPYPIMTGTAMDGDAKDGYVLYPLEFTPLYFGTAGAFKDSQPPLGGGYVEPWGLHSVPGVLHCSEDGCTGTVKISRDEEVEGKVLHTVPLAQAVAVSSSFLAAARDAIPDDLAFAREWLSTETLMNWGVLPNEDNKVPEHKLMKFADGGILDNLAVMPLLRRGVKCIIVLLASPLPPDTDAATYAHELHDVASLFGAATRGPPKVAPGTTNKMCHVFGRDVAEGQALFQELFSHLKAQREAGKPGFYRASYPIRENKFFHIPARSEPVEVLWISNQQWASWEDSLPKGTREKLLHDRSAHGFCVSHTQAMDRCLAGGEVEELLAWQLSDVARQTDLQNFPYYSTYTLDYSDAAVRLLSQMHTDIIKDPEVQDHIRGLVKVATDAKQKAQKAQKAQCEVAGAMQALQMALAKGCIQSGSG